MISNSKFYRRYITNAAAELLITEGRKRKSLLIQNTHDSHQLCVGNSKDLYSTNQYIIVEPNSVIELSIPEDNPRDPLWAISIGGTISVRIYEAYSQ